MAVLVGLEFLLRQSYSHAFECLPVEGSSLSSAFWAISGLSRSGVQTFHILSSLDVVHLFLSAFSMLSNLIS